jgi:hypothetical protein
VRRLRLAGHVDKMDDGKFQFLTPLNIKTTALWAVTPCNLVHTILWQEHIRSSFQKNKPSMLP